MKQLKHLINYDQEIMSWSQNGSVLMHFLQPKIKQFYNDNGIRLQTAYGKINSLIEEHFELDENKKIKTIEVEKDGNKSQQRVLKEGKSNEEYDKLYMELMDSETKIK